MDIKELALLMNEQIRVKINEVDEIGSGIALMRRMKMPQEAIENNMSKLRAIALELEPLYEVVQSRFPKHYKLLIALKQEVQEMH